MWTIKEFIEKLQKCPQDYFVLMADTIPICTIAVNKDYGNGVVFISDEEE